MHDDRRRHRSEVPAEAARLYLQAVADRHDLDAVTLANEDGLLIAAHSRVPLDLPWVAAVGSVCAVRGGRGPALGSLVERITGGRQLSSVQMVLRGERLYLTAVGGPLLARTQRDAAAAVERILADSLPAAA